MLDFMLKLFTWFSEMLSASWWLALISSFTWGVLSIVLSPCHLAAIPLLVAFINDRENITKRRAAFLIFFGIYMMDIIKLPFLEQGVKPIVKRRVYAENCTACMLSA